jgi:hypothetical protein
MANQEPGQCPRAGPVPGAGMQPEALELPSMVQPQLRDLIRLRTWKGPTMNHISIL